VALNARRAGQRLILCVSNPVDAESAADASGLGQGLRHLQARVQHDADDAGTVAIERGAGRFTITLSLPWQA
jgi:hypothetical protein